MNQLNDEYINWTRQFGIGRNENDLRFGQFIVNKYTQFPPYTSGLDLTADNARVGRIFYTEDIAEAYELSVEDIEEYGNRNRR